ncbi:MAG TPA: copper-binding protein [Thermoanaerobaculia bacterium]|nr:copper-binding protein [Thermoanaerobaculia bacterium]
MRRALKFDVALALILLLPAAGCGARGRNYTMRALVVQAPDAANPAGAGSLYLYHEPIDDWVGRDGKRDGMDTMAMPFPVARSVPLAGVAANDKVEVTLHVDWTADRPIEITRLRKLPADTRLVFRSARPGR